MQVDRDNPVHVEAEVEFAAIVAKVMREARDRAEGAQVMAEQLTDLMAKRMMLGTAEAYDGLEQHAECWQTRDTRQAA